MANYEIFLADVDGRRQQVLTDFVSLSYTLAVNDFGSMVLTLPGTGYSLDDFERDYRLEVERDGLLQGGAPFLIRRKNMTLSEQGEYIVLLEAFHANHYLDRFWTMYYAGSDPAGASNEAIDNVMRRIVRYNLGENADDSERDEAGPVGLIAVEANRSEAGQVTKGFARRKLSNVLGELAQKSRQDGLPLFFGMVKTGEGELEFWVRIQQWGLDRTGGAAISPEFGNLVAPVRALDWADEVSVAYALGQGEEAARAVAVAKNTTLLSGSDSYWIEEAINAASISLADSLQAEADALLQSRRFRSGFGGRLQNTPAFEYGQEWGWGDKLRAEFNDEMFNVWVNVVSVNVANGEEKISSSLEVVDA